MRIIELFNLFLLAFLSIASAEVNHRDNENVEIEVIDPPPFHSDHPTTPKPTTSKPTTPTPTTPTPATPKPTVYRGNRFEAKFSSASFSPMFIGAKHALMCKMLFNRSQLQTHQALEPLEESSKGFMKTKVKHILNLK